MLLRFRRFLALSPWNACPTPSAQTGKRRCATFNDATGLATNANVVDALKTLALPAPLSAVLPRLSDESRDTIAQHGGLRNYLQSGIEQDVRVIRARDGETWLVDWAQRPPLTAADAQSDDRWSNRESVTTDGDLPPPPECPAPPLGTAPKTHITTRAEGVAHIPKAPDAARSRSYEGDNADVSENAINASSLVSVIPSYFVPADEVLSFMPPGYTVGHLQSLFVATKLMQMVCIGGGHFIRFHGGYGYADMAASCEAEARFPRYRPDPSLLKPFGAAFAGRLGSWIPLADILAVNAAAAAGLPFQGEAALLCFAQMQHLFSFSPENGGSVARVSDVRGLNMESTPTPVTCNELLRVLEGHAMSCSALLKSILSPLAVRQLQTFFPSWASFAAAHESLFWYDAEKDVIMQRRQAERLRTKTLSLEEQLQLAVQQRDRKKIRNLRRKIALQSDPDNPLLDREKLCQAVSEFLPAQGHVSMRRLLKNLPYEITNLLPTVHTRFFKNNPQHFVLFEFEFANNFHFMRPGQSLPEGHLKTALSDEEIVQVVASRLQRKPSQSISELQLYLPLVAREEIKKRYRTLSGFILHYPQYFALVVSADSRNSENHSRVNLLHAPSEDEDSTPGNDDESTCTSTDTS